MDNKNNSDRDKMLEDILSDFSNKNSNNRSYNSRTSSSRPAPRKRINPTAFSSNDGNKTTGFAVSKMSDDNNSHEEKSHLNATSKINTNEQNNQYQEYTLNIKRPVAVEEKTSTTNKENFENTSSALPQNIRKKDSFYQPTQHNKNHSHKKSKKKKRSARLPVVLMVTTLILTISIFFSVLIISVGRDMLAIGKSDLKKMVTIPEGADVKAVADILKDENIIDIPKAFVFFAGLNGSDEAFIPGQYELSPSDAYETIIKKLTTDESDENKETVDITFTEGISIYDAAQLLEEKNVCDAERFIYYFNAGGFNFDFEKKLPTSTTTKFYKMEGYLFPDTYKFYVESDPESVCMKIYQNFENKMTDDYYKQMDKMGMTLDEVITLASIVQAEAPTVDSMKKVSAVLQNRLANEEEFPKLQSDPTTYYVEEIIKPNIQVPSNAIFEAYDTYQGRGLPPGAIGNPGIDAIEAVLYPDDNDYYYFCADIDTGEIFYSETLEEHEEYLAKINGESSDDDNEDDEDDYYE